MIRYIYFKYDDDEGCYTRSYVDATAAVKEWMDEVFGDRNHIEDWLNLLEAQRFIEHTYEPHGIIAVTKTEVF